MRWSWRGMPLVHAVLLGSACGVTDTDEPTPVGTIVVTPKALEVSAGGTGALEAEITDGAGNVLRGRRVVWASSNVAVATVSDNGVVTGVKSGSVAIAATVEGKSDVANVTVLPLVARVTRVGVAPDVVDLVVATGTNLVATPYDNRGAPISGRVVTWTTSNATVASVSQSGRVTGLVPGTAVISALIDGIGGDANVTVHAVPAAKVTVSPASATVGVGKTATLTARVTDAAGNILTGRAITWTSSDTRIFTVDQAGVIRGVRAGSSVVTATCEGKLGTATVRVN